METYELAGTYVTAEEYARVLGVSVATAKRRCAKSPLAIRIGRRQWLVKMENPEEEGDSL